MAIRLLVLQIRDDLTNFGGTSSHDQYGTKGDLFHHPVSMIEIILYHFFQAISSDVPMFHDLPSGNLT